MRRLQWHVDGIAGAEWCGIAGCGEGSSRMMFWETNDVIAAHLGMKKAGKLLSDGLELA